MRLETVEERSPAFLVDFFTDDEQQLAADAPAIHRDLLVTLLWSAKESALKAMGCGLRSDTRWVSVAPDHILNPSDEQWNQLSITHRSGRIFRGWWSEFGGLVRTVVAEPDPRLVELPPPGIHVFCRRCERSIRLEDCQRQEASPAGYSRLPNRCWPIAGRTIRDSKARPASFRWRDEGPNDPRLAAKPGFRSA